MPVLIGQPAGRSLRRVAGHDGPRHERRVQPPTAQKRQVSKAVDSEALQYSDELHARVRRFAELADQAPLVMPTDADSFESLALDIARFQADQSPAYARLLERFRCGLDSVLDLPPVPADAFRFTRVAVHPPELDRAVFRTSGTTSADTGCHAVRDLRTYEELAVRLARRALFGRIARAVVIALAPPPTEPPTSSLSHMMRLYMEKFDGRALCREPAGAAFDLTSSERWLASSRHVDLDGLERAAQIARHRCEPFVLLTTSFALAAVIETLEGERIQLPQQTLVMLTGGFKGRRIRFAPKELRARTACAFGISEENIVGEYGMTELTSQMYEAPPPPFARGGTPTDRARSTGSFWPDAGAAGRFYAPPWLRVNAVDPASYRPLPPGTAGLARFVDLANVDSAVCIVTDDLIVEHDQGFELLGRRSRAEPRGCSLPYEGLLGRRGHE